MKVYAISDLHLSGENTTKPMEVFDSQWAGHAEKIRENWEAVVEDGDSVLISGDISWAMYLEEAQSDLDFIGRLRGNKIMVRGNHDYWWGGISKVRAALREGTHALQNDSIRLGRAVICGTRGWTLPEAHGTAAEDIKIYNREVARLKLSLESASAKRKEGDIFICMTHFPPFNSKFEDSGFTALFSEYKVDKAVYGHLHGFHDHASLYHEKDGIEYYLTSCNLVNNELVLIWPGNK